MTYRFGIPSYRRKDCLYTLDTLKRLGYEKKDIVISTQAEDDYREYKRLFCNDAIIIFRPATNDSENRNTVIDYMEEGERFILADDDIKAFSWMEEFGGKKQLFDFTSKQQLEKMFDKMFAFCEMRNSPIWAWYPVPNAFFMKNSIDLRNIFVGTILGVKNNRKIRFDESFDLKGDYEISLRLMKMGYNTVRFNSYTAKANHKSKGGCEDARKAGHNERRCKVLLERYPELIKESHRKGEIRFIGKNRKRGERQ